MYMHVIFKNSTKNDHYTCQNQTNKQIATVDDEKFYNYINIKLIIKISN